jgi:hypothetical protein
MPVNIIRDAYRSIAAIIAASVIFLLISDNLDCGANN